MRARSTCGLYGNCNDDARRFTQALSAALAGREVTLAPTTRPPLIATQTSSEVCSGTAQLLSHAPFSSTAAMACVGKSAARLPPEKSMSWLAEASAASQEGSALAERARERAAGSGRGHGQRARDRSSESGEGIESRARASRVGAACGIGRERRSACGAERRPGLGPQSTTDR